MDWFEELFGFKEYLGIENKFIIENRILRSLVNNCQYDIGEFSCPSVKELRDSIPKFSYSKVRVKHIACNDVFYLQTTNDNESLFMAASQFNCLEFPNPRNTPKDGITNYIRDNTQGPACALATAPATVYRNYFIKEINNLDEIQDFLKESFFSVKNGYINSTVESIKLLNLRLHEKELVDKLNDKLKVGLLLNAQVPFKNRYTKTDKLQYVSQVYCSAISCGYSTLPLDLWEPFSRIVLNASYKAVMYAAIVNKKKNIYLTFLGGGVFKNKMEWIIDAIICAITSVANFDLNIYIVHYQKIDVNIMNYFNKVLCC